MNKKTMLHSLRTPDRRDETETREARLQAADELERLYTFEKMVKGYIEKLGSTIKSLDKEDVLKGTCLECSISPCMCEVHG